MKRPATSVLFLFFFFISCSSSNEKNRETFFRETKVSANLIDSLSFESRVSGRKTKIQIHDSLIYLIQPFDSRILVYNQNSKENAEYPVLRPTRESGNRIEIINGTLNSLFVEDSLKFGIETGTSKIRVFGRNWTSLDTIYPPIEIKFPHSLPGILERNQNKLIMSKDDFLGRWLNKEILIQDNTPILFSLDILNGEYSPIIRGKQLKTIFDSDTVPFFKMASSNENYHLVEVNNGSIHDFDKEGKYVGKDTSFLNYLDLDNLSFLDFRNRYGINRFILDSNFASFFIRLKPTKSLPVRYQIVKFDLKKSTYWIHEIVPKRGTYTYLIDFKNGKDLYVLFISEKGQNQLNHFRMIE